VALLTQVVPWMMCWQELLYVQGSQVAQVAPMNPGVQVQV
jgi:hypothetical protein